MSKHTPGPWVVNGFGGDFREITRTSKGVAISVTSEKGGDIANARLIAAAPDLLEALKGELAASRSDCNDRKCGACSRCHSYAAIAKAEGGSHE
jgi:hypothetical protein